MNQPIMLGQLFISFCRSLSRKLLLINFHAERAKFCCGTKFIFIRNKISHITNKELTAVFQSITNVVFFRDEVQTERKNPQYISAPSKFYVAPVNSGKRTLSTLFFLMERNSSFSRGDILNVLSNFLDEFSEYF